MGRKKLPLGIVASCLLHARILAISIQLTLIYVHLKDKLCMSVVRHELGSRGYIPFENVVLCSGETMPYLYRAVLLVWTPNDSEDYYTVKEMFL